VASKGACLSSLCLHVFAIACDGFPSCTMHCCSLFVYIGFAFVGGDQVSHVVATDVTVSTH
jgi:hypothetical protein